MRTDYHGKGSRKRKNIRSITFLKITQKTYYNKQHQDYSNITRFYTRDRQQDIRFPIFIDHFLEKMEL